MSAQTIAGAVNKVKFYMGAIAPIPVRVHMAERILENEWNDETCEKLAAYLSDMLRRIPAEYDRGYKMFAVKGAVYDVLRMFPFFA